MFIEDDLVVITLTNQPTNKIFGLIRNGERITEKARLHKSYRRSIFSPLLFNVILQPSRKCTSRRSS